MRVRVTIVMSATDERDAQTLLTMIAGAAQMPSVGGKFDAGTVETETGMASYAVETE